ncbi:MAG TPA: hypothetical protein PK359_17110 [Burkholderiaceae bacterium]|jgi:hypothetical protein|nr:hypothetical protein [Burkholderiaceae bacterium]
MTSSRAKLPATSRLTSLRQMALALGMAAALAATPQRVLAGPNDASLLSAVSMLPVAVSVVAPVMVLTAGARFSVRAVESTANGSLLVLERASDGVQCSIELSGKALDRASVKVGSAVEASAIGAGMILSAAGTVIAFVPNEVGKALLHHQPISR